MSLDQAQINALQLAVSCIKDAAKVAGPSGAPSGVIYSQMSQHGMSLLVYQQIVGALERSNIITVENHCIKLVD